VVPVCWKFRVHSTESLCHSFWFIRIVPDKVNQYSLNDYLKVTLRSPRIRQHAAELNWSQYVELHPVTHIQKVTVFYSDVSKDSADVGGIELESTGMIKGPARNNLDF